MEEGVEEEGVRDEKRGAGEMEGKRRSCFYTISLRACCRGEPTLTLGIPYLVPWGP